MIRYTITAVKKNGLRELAFDNNAKQNHKTKAIAEKVLSDIRENNTQERIKELIGTDLRIDPVECWPGGDSKRTIFED